MYFVEHRVWNVYLIQKRYPDLLQRWEWSTVLNMKKSKARYVTWTSYFYLLYKNKTFLSNVFGFISLWHPMQNDFEEIEFCNQKYWKFYLRERKRKQPNNCFVWVCEFVISCRYRKSADVSILRIWIKSVKLYTRHWYRL